MIRRLLDGRTGTAPESASCQVSVLKFKIVNAAGLRH